MGTHKCHATGCEREVPPKMFMCRQHWFALPKSYRDAVWTHYQKGQEVSKTPSQDYLKVAAAAIKWLVDHSGNEAQARRRLPNAFP